MDSYIELGNTELWKVIFFLRSARKYLGCLDGDPGFRKIASK